ncbi:ankyrin repeat domain-containing protein [Marinigracilibium pacificum]|uniref:Ankyrin repeat domain-containing protein n=1 Tax=Marinigracilibium pacificum TaxID=2729599 RepID=A0A848IY17_9BACT|nr:ankyrin repeat domain-containing protein [Marinigracilibium pacificum]NMM49187.1 ankyrin repeat domain-containing protein [Marinigracilibium pacificum]
MDFYQAVSKNNIEIVENLLLEGFDVNTKDEFGETGVHISVSKNNFDILKILIDHQANIDILNEEGYSPAQIAVIDGSYESLKTLLENGADIKTIDPNGNTLLANAVMHYRGDDRIIKLLLEKGIDPKIENNHGISLFNLLNMPKNKDIKHLFE